MTRVADWAARLDGFVQENAARRFQYGEWDCCLFVCEGIRVMTGVDVGAQFRGRYGDARGARGVLREEVGVASVPKITERIAERLGMTEIGIGFAQRGDLVLLPRPARGWSLGLMGLGGTVLVAGGKGLLRVPVQTVFHAWRV